MKDALFDLEAALEDHEDAKTITDRLILEYGLEPFILSTGQLGIHFMELSYSIEGETLIGTARAMKSMRVATPMGRLARTNVPIL